MQVLSFSPTFFHPNGTSIYNFTKIFIRWFWRVSIMYYPLFILHFLYGPGQTREMESQWGEEVGSNKDDHHREEKAARESNFMQFYTWVVIVFSCLPISWYLLIIFESSWPWLQNRCRKKSAPVLKAIFVTVDYDSFL